MALVLVCDNQKCDSTEFNIDVDNLAKDLNIVCAKCGFNFFGELNNCLKDEFKIVVDDSTKVGIVTRGNF